MRYLILGLLFFAMGCSGQKKRSINNNSVIDTVKLFDANPQEGKLVEQQAVLCNCLILEKEKIAAGIECQKIELQNDKELKELLQKSVANIAKQKFYIVYSNNTSVKRIFEIIDIVKAAKIEDYKVITLQSLLLLMCRWNKIGNSQFGNGVHQMLTIFIQIRITNSSKQPLTGGLYKCGWTEQQLVFKSILYSGSGRTSNAHR